MRSYRNTKWYRSRHGIIFGVCQGFAEWKDLSVGMIRF
ncbi:MAG: PspC domain-containing protein, partial [Spirochaetia bacterium]|nr:PspC domain-containing protein [Spirochaetia bacterium]